MASGALVGRYCFIKHLLECHLGFLLLLCPIDFQRNLWHVQHFFLMTTATLELKLSLGMTFSVSSPSSSQLTISYLDCYARNRELMGHRQYFLNLWNWSGSLMLLDELCFTQWTQHGLLSSSIYWYHSRSLDQSTQIWVFLLWIRVQRYHQPCLQYFLDYCLKFKVWRLLRLDW